MKAFFRLSPFLLTGVVNASLFPRAELALSSRTKDIPSVTSRSAFLELRGGAVFGTPISKENLAWLLIGNSFFNGVIGIAAPETLADSWSAPPVKEGTLAHLCFELIGAGLFSVALALYLARFTDTAAHDLVCLSSIPTTFVIFRHFLKGTAGKLGFRKGMWEVLLAQLVLSIELIMARKGNTKLIANFLSATPALIGISGMLDKNFSKAIWGASITDGPTVAAFRWMSRINFQCGILYLLLLHGVDPFKAAGYVAMLYAFQCFDFAFVTKDRDFYPNQPEWIMKVFIVVWALAGLGLIRE